MWVMNTKPHKVNTKPHKVELRFHPEEWKQLESLTKALFYSNVSQMVREMVRSETIKYQEMFREKK